MSSENSIIDARPTRRTVTLGSMVLVLGLLSLPAPARAARHGVCSPPGPDAEVARQVRDEMLAVPRLDGSKMKVEAQDGVVTLTGTVPDLQAHHDAVRAARMMRHVRAVIDRLHVAPAFRDNLQLRRAVERALRLDHDADAADISVLAEDGVVTLTGTVESAQQRMNALDAVRGVRGVARVRSQITMTPRMSRPDRAIWTDIRRGIDEDLLLQPAVIDVEVHDGAVTLTGFVATAAQRAEAVNQAWTSGVWKVQDRLSSASWAAEDGLRDTHCLPDDAALRRAVLAALRQDPRVASNRIDVTVIAGVVTLGGEASTLAGKQAAARDAGNTPGVSQVLDVQLVHPGPEGAPLAARVRRALRRDPDLRRYDLDVRAARGEVYVNGQVVNEFDHQAVMRAVARVPGVSSIQDQVISNHTRRLPSDGQIAWRTRLWFHLTAPFPLRDVSVSVRDGIAVLRGSVPHPFYRTVAESIARRAGALRVSDQLVAG
jgi:osmotically-inducible protein OsmY